MYPPLNNISAIQAPKVIGDGNIKGEPPYKIGKVIEVLIDDNIPSTGLFIRDGGWEATGTVYYVEYPESEGVSTIERNVNLFTLPKAKPLIPNQNHIPLKGELILVFPPLVNDETKTSYYVSSINQYNNINQNASLDGAANLGNTFTKKDFSKNILFEGDSIYESRFGSSLHFTSTIKNTVTDRKNWWSDVGLNGDPITFLTNGYSINKENPLPYHIEDILLDKSSIYLTSTQRIPLNKTFQKQKIFNPTPLGDYFNSQVILNGDRIILNAKTDSILGFANYIGLSSKYSTYLESNEVTINANIINLGVLTGGNAPTEPILLGNTTTRLLVQILTTLKASALKLATAVSTNSGTPLTSVQSAGQDMLTQISTIENQYGITLSKLKSRVTYTI